MTAQSDPVTSLSKRNLALIILLIAVVTAMLVPTDVFAAQAATSGAGGTVSSCATQDGKQIDYSTCLPSGRWGGLVGSIGSRIEPANGILGPLSNLMSTMSTGMRQILPNMFLMITQVCWSSALALSQFAASFTPLQTAGAELDHSAAKLIEGLMQGAVPAALVVMAIVGVILAAGFDVGTTKEAGKRLVTTVLCLAALIVMGNGAAKTGTNASTPATGSPWWVVKTINDTVNTITVGLDLDGMNDGNGQMMAHKHAKNNPNCQDYLYEMHDQYKHSGAEQDGKETSAVTLAVNRLWEETALRNWVTMQWNNPTASGNVTDQQAANAQQAYCHILDLENNTDPIVQKELTNKELGTHIDDQTAKWIFTYNGWISTYNSLVDDGKQQDDRDNTVRATRAGVFWETCGSDGKNVVARKGWAKIINNIGDSGTGTIKNGKKSIRAAIDGNSLKDAEPTYPDSLMHAASDGSDDATNAAVQKLCNTVFHDQGVFHRDSDGYGADKQNDTNVGDAATLGWRFDVPNLGATWREANAGAINDTTKYPGAAKSTLDYLYGNVTPDTLGAFGSVLGSLCNMIVWGLLSLILIVSKLMLCIMTLFLVAAFLVRAVPFGEAPKRVLKNWAKFTLNLSMTGTLYAILGTIATFICQLTLKFCSGMTSTFVYNIISGISPVLAIAILSLFCSQIVKCGNPFSIHGMMNVAGGGALAAGVAPGLLKGMRMMQNGLSSITNRADGNGNGHANRMSSIHAGGGTHGKTTGQTILDRMSEQQQERTNQRIKLLGKDSLAAKWSHKDADTIRGSLAGTAALAGTQWAKAKEKWHQDTFDEDAYRRRIAGTLPPGADIEQAVNRARRLHNIPHKLNAGVHALGAAGATAFGVAKSKPLYKAALHGGIRAAKIAALAGGTALAFSNPITAPAGLALATKIALNPKTRMAAKVGLGAVREGSYSIKDLWTNHPITPQMLRAFDPNLVPENPFDIVDKAMRDENGNLTEDAKSAQAKVDTGMLDSYMNDEHMSVEEAADMVNRQRADGKLDQATARLFADEHMGGMPKPVMPGSDGQPIMPRGYVPKPTSTVPIDFSEPPKGDA